MKMKKFAALAVATVMSVSAIAATSAFGVFATTDAGVNNIVIKDSDTNRVYKAYQIFDQASATNTIKWGKGINGDALLTSLKLLVLALICHSSTVPRAQQTLQR